jgi:hypothetical protein
MLAAGSASEWIHSPGAGSVLEIPKGLVDEIILVDDASSDETPGARRGADVVIMVHPDNQYDPGFIPRHVAADRGG